LSDDVTGSQRGPELAPVLVGASPDRTASCRPAVSAVGPG
jgi:hypothetical protein